MQIAALLLLSLLLSHVAVGQTETVLFNFDYNDGQSPTSSLTSDRDGNFYGTTVYGGLEGSVFELSPNGNGGWNEATLYYFCSVPNCTDGAQPYLSNVIFDSAGNLYGTTQYGGVNDAGVVFELSPGAAGWTERVLYSFGPIYGSDGSVPRSGLIMDSAGNLYGTTSSGGGCRCGTVFELSPSGGGWTEQVIYSNSGGSLAGLTMDADGKIFGVGFSTVFELSANGNGGWNPTVIHTFTGAPKDGSFPAYGTPVLDQAGNLYGTTNGGGTKNLGTVYKLSPGKKGKWTEKILHSFKGEPRDGSAPLAGIVFDSAGNIYGTTSSGGKFDQCGCEGGDGTVFELTAPVEKGAYKEKILWNMDGTDGSAPTDSLILDSAGNLYGTAGGGSYNVGVVFAITP